MRDTGKLPPLKATDRIEQNQPTKEIVVNASSLELIRATTKRLAQKIGLLEMERGRDPQQTPKVARQVQLEGQPQWKICFSQLFGILRNMP